MDPNAFAIVVEFALTEGAGSHFLTLVRQNAATSVREEAGCLRFDVLTGEKEGQVLLYEVYADAAAFEAHLATRHFEQFDRVTRDLVAAKSVLRFDATTFTKAV